MKPSKLGIFIFILQSKVELRVGHSPHVLSVSNIIRISVQVELSVPSNIRSPPFPNLPLTLSIINAVLKGDSE